MKNELWIVTNCEFNRQWYSDIIGLIYICPPSYAIVEPYLG